MRWTVRRRLLVAGIGALALHLLFALFVVTRPGPKRPAAPAPPPLAVRLIETPGPQAPAASPQPPGRTVRAGETPAPSRGAPAAPATRGPGEQAQEPAPAEPWSGPWRSAEGVGPGISTTLPDADVLPPGSAPEGLVREKTREEKLAEEKESVRRSIEGWAGDEAARERARSTPDSRWRNFGDYLANGFDPGWDILDQGPPQQSGTIRRQFWDSWKQQAQAYGKTGSPFPEAERRSLNQEIFTMRNEDRGLGGVSLGSVPQGVINFGLVTEGLAGNTFTRQLVTQIKISQREDGSIFAVELFGTSGNAAYDRLAVAQAKKLDKLGLATPKGGRATLWAFSTTFTQVPPVPIAGCGLDDFVPKHCFYPLQKSSRSRVTLLAIY